MLLCFSVENFLSFNEKEVFSLNAGKGRMFNERVYTDGKNKILKFSAVFGANGSGKTNLVKAVSFAQQMIIQGIKNASSNSYFKLDETRINTPSKFEFKLLLDGRTYSYGFSILLSTNQIFSEWLFDDSTKTRKTIFYRDINNSTSIIDEYFSNKELNNMLKVYADGIKSNSEKLILNVLNDYNNIFDEYPESRIIKKIYDWFKLKLRIISPYDIVNNYTYLSSEKFDQIVKLFDKFGFSITDYKMVNCSFNSISSRIPKAIYDNIINDITNSFNNPKTKIRESVIGINTELFLITKPKDELVCQTIQFYHDNYPVPFSLSEESDGTLRILKLIEILLQKDNEIVYFVDEIDRCLHAKLTYSFIKEFLNTAITTNNQLVVTTHETVLLDYNLLRKDEMWFVEKQQGASHLLPLGATQERADKKIVKSYLLDTLKITK